jgi:hypothetical protein
MKKSEKTKQEKPDEIENESCKRWSDRSNCAATTRPIPRRGSGWSRERKRERHSANRKLETGLTDSSIVCKIESVKVHSTQVINMNSKERLADEIFNQLDRLNVSTNQDVYSGLMCGYRNLLIEGLPDAVVVEIYDDQAECLYYGQRVLEYLKNVVSATLEPESPENIWDLIREFEL